ncbi:MAG TPA: YtcA family lipoprotein [Thermoanaerobaculia bacterium]|nr:YtcA family lipoprotein [Thermoanaerobaculia bacterium]
MSQRRAVARAFPWLTVLASAVACDPSINLWGSYFPGWVACLAGGVAVSALLRTTLARLGLERHLGPLLLIYPCLLLLTTLLFWIVFFQG